MSVPLPAQVDCEACERLFSSSLLRNNNITTNLQRLTSGYGSKQGCQFGFFEARFWNSGFLNARGFFENEKSRQNLALFQSDRLGSGKLAKHCLICIFNKNLF